MSNFDDGALDPRFAAEVQEVTGFLNEVGVLFVRPTLFHLKIGKINYYFGRGRIVVDGERQRYPDTGLEALKDLLQKRGYLRSLSSADGKPIQPRR